MKMMLMMMVLVALALTLPLLLVFRRGINLPERREASLPCTARSLQSLTGIWTMAALAGKNMRVRSWKWNAGFWQPMQHQPNLMAVAPSCCC